MSDELVPKHGKKDVAFAGAQLSDAWILIGSVFLALFVGSTVGWLAYIGIPVLGFGLTKFYIQWKSNNLPGYLRVILYRLGISGYSPAFNRKKKRFIGDSKVVNPSALQIGAIMRAEAAYQADALEAADTAIDFSKAPVNDDASELVS